VWDSHTKINYPFFKSTKLAVTLAEYFFTDLSFRYIKIQDILHLLPEDCVLEKIIYIVPGASKKSYFGF
jgi:hypothetical protein